MLEKERAMKTLKCMLLAAGVSCFALAGNVVYTGGGTGALSDGDAWEGGVAPGAGRRGGAAQKGRQQPGEEEESEIFSPHWR